MILLERCVWYVPTAYAIKPDPTGSGSSRDGGADGVHEKNEGLTSCFLQGGHTLYTVRCKPGNGGWLAARPSDLRWGEPTLCVATRQGGLAGCCIATIGAWWGAHAVRQGKPQSAWPLDRSGRSRCSAAGHKARGPPHSPHPGGGKTLPPFRVQCMLVGRLAPSRGLHHHSLCNEMPWAQVVASLGKKPVLSAGPATDGD